jgi:hypothetical protein
VKSNVEHYEADSNGTVMGQNVPPDPELKGLPSYVGSDKGEWQEVMKWRTTRGTTIRDQGYCGRCDEA